jgi:hypothetical protein
MASALGAVRHQHLHRFGIERECRANAKDVSPILALSDARANGESTGDLGMMARFRDDRAADGG